MLPVRLVGTAAITSGDAALVERGGELAEVGAAIERARSGTGSVVLLEGHAGIGKTRLVAASAELARSAGLEVLSARGSELEAEFSFGVVLQLFERALRGLDAGERRSVFAGAANLAEPLLAGHEGPLTDGRGDVFTIFHGLFWVAANLCERVPLALLIDDAHWADPPSLSFVEYVAHRIEGLPLVVVLAARPSEPNAAGDLLLRLASHRATAVVRPLPLTRGGVGSLMAAWGFPDAERGFVEACWRASGGFPLYLRELLVVLADAAVSATDANSQRVAQIGPETVMAAIRVSLRPLPP
ncbi:MAG: hypothetical protein QOD53_946, partial [Thermoleophilaceae bacterium]|nr:hypothetical protein [Thermoleophilaceae bacterium]